MLKRIIILVFFSLLLDFSNQIDIDEISYLMNPSEELILWPQPVNISTGSGIIDLGDGTQFQFKLIDTPELEHITTIIEIYSKIIFKNKAQNEYEFNSQKYILIKIENPYLIDLQESTSEAYELHITSDYIKLQAETYYGVVRGLETFSQLIYYNVTYSSPQRTYKYYIPQVPIYISDQPKFSYRGVLLDTSRHYISIKSIKRTIDGLMYSKMNVLHWHVMDDESYPLQSKIFPDLNTSAYSQNEVYTHQDVQEIILYAQIRGVRVVVEIDQPGHVLSWGFSESIRESIVGWQNQVLIIPSGFLDPTIKQTYEVVSKLFKELTTVYSDKYIHLGGDEVYTKVWDTRPSILEKMKKANVSSYQELQNMYTQRVREILHRIDDKVKPIYWSNLDTLFINYRKGDILQWWGLQSNLSFVMERYKEQQFIITSYDYLYLDCGSGSYLGTNSWCEPYKTWKRIYSLELPDDPRILGSVAAMWSELVTDEILDSKLWPRLAALNEVLWTYTKSNNVASVGRRLGAHSYRLVQRGIASGPITSQTCQRNTTICLGEQKF